MTTVFAILIISVILLQPILLVTLVVRALLKKSIKKLGIAILICIGSIIPLTILGTITDPATWCEHEYEVIEDVAPTCTEKGRIVRLCSLCDSKDTEKLDTIAHAFEVVEDTASSCTESGKIVKKCSMCGSENIEYLDKNDHSWEICSILGATCTKQGEVVKKCTSCGIEDIKHDAVIDHSWVIDTTIIANCTTGGYTMERCEVCSSTRQTNVTAVLGHNMVYVTRIEPTYKTDGKIITGCNRCDYEETEVLPKLEYAKIEFDELRLTFGEYSFTEVNNKYSEYHKKPIVKIPVTVENISGSPHSLNMFYYTVFDSSGVESADVGYYFTDDISQGGELLSGKSYTKYFHIVYDGDGVYTIVFDNMLFEKKTVEISVKK